MATEDATPVPDQYNSTPPPSSSKKRKSNLPELEVDLSLPEPPSKKAKRALKKGKPLLAPKHSDSEASDLDLPSKEDRKSKKERSQYGVWIGNLAFTLTRPDLFNWLVDSSGGSISKEAILRVNLPTQKDSNPHAARGEKKTSPANRGFAYVDFSTYEACVAAIALSETELSGRKVLIKDCKSFEGRPAKNQPGDGGGETPAATTPGKDKKDAAMIKSRKVFVGNLAFNTNEDELWAHFEKCGEIDWVKVATFEDTGKCKGFGWVKFQDATAAEWAVKGFVRIAEAEETEEDFVDGAEAEDEDKQKTPRKTKTRKWWVNTLRGRSLKIEMAEDDQVRYKKRFGKDAPKPGTVEKAVGQISNAGDHTTVPRIRYHDDISVARLIGAAVAPQNKKISLQ